MLKFTGNESPMAMDAVEQGSPEDVFVVCGPCGCGDYVPALPPIADLPPMADLEEVVPEFIVGEFEFCGEVDSATSCQMDAFLTVFCR